MQEKIDIKKTLKHNKIKQGELADFLGVSKGYISQVIAGKSKLSAESLAKIAKHPSWTIVYQGDILEDDSEEKIERVPLYNFDAVAGMHRNNAVFDTAENIIATIPFLNAIQGDVAITVTGDSMLPKYESGSILLLRPVERWREYFGFGNCFVLLLEDGRRVLKQIQKVPGNSEKVLCVSINEKYPAEELPKSMIVKVFKVIACLNNEGY